MFIRHVRDTVEKFGLLEKADRVVVAVSGGPDSTALLAALNALRREYGLKLHIAHLDHMLRARAEAKGDCDFVAGLAKRFGLPLSMGRAGVAEYAKGKGLSIEEAARHLRYEFLLNVAKDTGANKIALGHTLDDQAETVLMRLMRGAGLSGLRGIPPIRRLNGAFIVRPLLETQRKDIEKYLRARRIRPRQDLTNLMPKFLRNRIRHKLIPSLERYNPNIKEVLARSAQSLAYDYEVLSAVVEAVFEECARVKGDSVAVNLWDLESKPRGLKRHILRRAIETLKGDLRKIDYLHVEKIEDLMRSGKGSLNLPGGFKVTKKGGEVIFQRPPGAGKRRPELSLRLSVPGLTAVADLNLLFDARILEGGKGIGAKIRKGARLNKARRVEYLDYDKLKLPLFLRTWRDGDRFRPLGMTAEKKLQDFFVDAKIPRHKRGAVPLLVSGKKIAWVCGLRISDEFKLCPSTKRVLKLSYRETPG